MLYSESFAGLEELVVLLQDAALYARVNNYGAAPAIEASAREFPEDPQALRVFEETLSDKSTQLVAVVVA